MAVKGATAFYPTTVFCSMKEKSKSIRFLDELYDTLCMSYALICPITCRAHTGFFINPLSLDRQPIILCGYHTTDMKPTSVPTKSLSLPVTL